MNEEILFLVFASGFAITWLVIFRTEMLDRWREWREERAFRRRHRGIE